MFEFSGQHIAQFTHGLVFEAVNLSGVIRSLWLSPAEWNLVSSEHSFVLVLSLCASYLLEASRTQKMNFVWDYSICQKSLMRNLKVWKSVHIF